MPTITQEVQPILLSVLPVYEAGMNTMHKVKRRYYLKVCKHYNVTEEEFIKVFNDEADFSGGTMEFVNIGMEMLIGSIGAGEPFNGTIRHAIQQAFDYACVYFQCVLQRDPAYRGKNPNPRSKNRICGISL